MSNYIPTLENWRGNAAQLAHYNACVAAEHAKQTAIAAAQTIPGKTGNGAAVAAAEYTALVACLHSAVTNSLDTQTKQTMVDQIASKWNLDKLGLGYMKSRIVNIV